MSRAELNGFWVRGMTSDLPSQKLVLRHYPEAKSSGEAIRMFLEDHPAGSTWGAEQAREGLPHWATGRRTITVMGVNLG